MKFNKQMDSGALLIPRAAFKISSFEADEKTEIHCAGQRSDRSEKADDSHGANPGSGRIA